MRCVDAIAGLVEWCAASASPCWRSCFASPAMAEKGKLRERLTSEVVAKVFPGGVERLGPEEGSPPAIAVFQGGKVVAFAFSTLDIVAAPGYSTTPFDVIAGVDLGGRITGAEVVFHNEPHIVHDASAPAPARYFPRARSRQAALRRRRRAAAGFRRRCDRQRARHAGRRPRLRAAGAARARPERRRHGSDPRCRRFQAHVVGRAPRRGRRGAPAGNRGRGGGGSCRRGRARRQARRAARQAR